jgi:hypothetical protein
VLFDGLMRQSEINRLLDEIFDPEGASLDEAEDVVFTLYYEEGERENADHALMLIA